MECAIQRIAAANTPLLWGCRRRDHVPRGALRRAVNRGTR